MPINNNLDPVTLPMALRFGEKPQTEFKNDLDALKVVLLDWPESERVRRMVYQFVNATWEDSPGEHNPDNVDPWKLHHALESALKGKALPTVLETLDFTFRIEGIDLQTVTHLIRHRAASFSAQCSGDRWQSNSSAVVPGPVQNSPELYERWKKHVEEAKQLYCDMIDTKKISIMDARTILPRAIETHYYARFNLKDLIMFFHQRFDQNIQPVIDNAMAYLMFIEVAKVFPEVLTVVNPHAMSKHFVVTARTGKATNLYFPCKENDVFEYNEKDFIYSCQRDEMNGTDPELGKRENFKFTKFQNECDEEILQMKNKYELWKKDVGFVE